MGTPDRPELGDELTDSFCRTDPAKALVFARTTFLSDNRADLARVSVPTLVIECAHDTLAPREVGAYVHEQIPGSRLVTLDATGHCPHLSAPGATAEAIADFAVRRQMTHDVSVEDYYENAPAATCWHGRTVASHGSTRPWRTGSATTAPLSSARRSSSCSALADASTTRPTSVPCSRRRGRSAVSPSIWSPPTTHGFRCSSPPT